MARESDLIVPSRRGFLRGLGAAAGLALAAPAIVKAESLMKLAPMQVLRFGDTIRIRFPADYVVDAEISRLDVLYGYVNARPKWTFPIDEYSDKILAPMANKLTERIYSSVMNGDGGSPYGLLGLLGHLPADYVTRISNVD